MTEVTAAEPQVAANADVPSYVYALGRVEARTPTLGVEKEVMQVLGAANAGGLTDRQALYDLLTAKDNRYIAKKMCWVLTIEGMEAYVLVPRDAHELELLLETVRPAPRPTDVDVVIGVRGPLSDPSVCNGLMLPLVACDQIYSFDVDSFLKAIPRPASITARAFSPIAEELFFRIQQLADNAGATDEDRALNYCAVRYPAIYELTAEMYANNCSLSSVDVQESRLSGPRRIADVVFSYRDRATDVESKYFVRVDVEERFPFLVTKLGPFYDR